MFGLGNTSFHNFAQMSNTTDDLLVLYFIHLYNYLFIMYNYNLKKNLNASRIFDLGKGDAN